MNAYAATHVDIEFQGVHLRRTVDGVRITTGWLLNRCRHRLEDLSRVCFF